MGADGLLGARLASGRGAWVELRESQHSPIHKRMTRERGIRGQRWPAGPRQREQAGQRGVTRHGCDDCARPWPGLEALAQGAESEENEARASPSWPDFSQQ